ncbi:MAG: glycosyltransferase family 2 protein [Nitrospirae bacterium]|nr:glycosyltransferase family 2 protein [Nitrospirota bacterium]
MLGAESIVILLGTYNGGQFVGEQIRSIQGQTVSNWKLLIRDDGSQDGTLEVIADVSGRDERIRCVGDGHGNLGVVGNFGELMRIAHAEEAEYIFFSDQDDVWVSNKIADQLTYLKEMESQHGQKTPILVYSDLEVVSEQLEGIHPSFMGYQGLTHESRDPLRVLLTQNFVTGCAMVINRPLLELATPLPADVIMHDWWLALCAAACGRIEYLPLALVRYRQHGANQIGAEGFFTMVNPLSDASGRRLGRSGYYVFGSIRHAALLGERVASLDVPCSAEALWLLKRFAACAHEGRFRRLWTVFQLRLRRQGLFRQVLLYWRLFVSPRASVMR